MHGDFAGSLPLEDLVPPMGWFLCRGIRGGAVLRQHKAQLCATSHAGAAVQTPHGRTTSPQPTWWASMRAHVGDATDG